MGTGSMGSVFGEYSFYRETFRYNVQDEGGRYLAEHSSGPRQAYSEIKLQGRDLVRVVGIFAVCPTRNRYPGKFRFIDPQGVMGTGDEFRFP